MAFPNATGSFSYSGTYTPEIWSLKLIENLYANTVLSQISNTNYEGEIKKKGDKVNIRLRPTMTTFAYTKGMKIPYTEVETSKIELLIDQGIGWAYPVNAVDEKQNDIDMDAVFADEASQQLKIDVEENFWAAVLTGSHASNIGATAGADTGAYDMGTGGAAIAVTKSNILDKIVDAGSVLDEQSVPEENRWMVIPPLFAGMIKKSDLKDASLSGDGTSIMRNGRLGMIDRFTLYSSRLVPISSDTGNKYNIMFGHPMALTFATQLVENEEIPNPDDFGRLRRGLNVFGRKVIKPQALGRLYVSKG